MNNEAVADIAVIGLAVMGQNLILNMNDHGYTVVAFNRTVSKIDDFLADGAKGSNVIGAQTIEELVSKLKRPRKVMLMVKAGAAVDATIDLLLPHLEAGDIIIDGGNSLFTDTIRRVSYVESQGLLYVGTGVSGGEEGARNGPSIMPGGSVAAWEHIKEIFQSIAAKVEDGSPCCEWVGEGGAGHYVKMVHNGIEYGDMQLIAEAYDMMRRILGMSAPEMADVFDEWNRGDLESFLIEITAKILRVNDPETGKPLVDLVLDKAGQKGTGKWTSAIALDLGIVSPTMDAAVDARNLSSRKDERVEASKQIKGPEGSGYTGDRAEMIAAIRDALYASKICSYAQGMNLIRAGSQNWNWDINLGEAARIWKGGCIIRAQFLDKIKQAYQRRADLPNLLLDPNFNEYMQRAQANWRKAVTTSMQLGVPVPGMAASVSYFDTYRTADLPLNLTQAQRDFFGSHTYERTDKPGAEAVHTEWEELLEKQG